MFAKLGVDAARKDRLKLRGEEGERDIQLQILIIYILINKKLIYTIKKISSAEHNDIYVLYGTPQVAIKQTPNQYFKNQIRQKSKGDFLENVWQLRFSVSNHGKREVAFTFQKNAGFSGF